MLVSKPDLITRLKKEILPLGGFGVMRAMEESVPGLGFMKESFPQGCFPLGVVHEFIIQGSEAAAATGGFISGILGGLMRNRGAVVWISSSGTVFPPALKMYGIDPERIIFIHLRKERDILWAMEEALKCNGLSAVIGEISELSFTISRRFQLAVEQSRVTGFVLRTNPRNPGTNALVSRWKIKPIPSLSFEELPGLGYPRWNIELLKIRNGKPGSWQLEWTGHQFNTVIQNIPSFVPEPKRKTG
jgi:protein ImuA